VEKIEREDVNRPEDAAEEEPRHQQAEHAEGLRELAEETGIIAGKLESLGIIHPSPGVFDEVVHLFLATELTQGEPDPEHYEDIEVANLPLQKAVRMAIEGEITDGKTAMALFRAAGRMQI